MTELAYISTGIVLVFFASFFYLQTRNIKLGKYSAKYIRIIFIVSMMLIAYSTWLGPNADMARYYMKLNGMKYQTLSEVFTTGEYKVIPITNLFFWIISQTGNNRLLLFISSACILSNVFKVISWEDPDNNYVNVQCIYLIQLFAVGTFAGILTSVRQAGMYSVFIMAVYRDTVQKKKDITMVLLYFCACMIHVSSVLFVIVRLCSFLRGKWKYLLLIWPIVVPLAAFLGEYNGLLGEAVEKFAYYEGMGGFDWRNYLARIGILCTIYYIMCFLKKNREIAKSEYFEYMMTLWICTIGAITSQHIFSRMLGAMVYQMFPLLVMFWSAAPEKKKSNYLVMLDFLCLGLLAFQLVTIRVAWRFL